MKGIIIYQSKYGSTETYAKWLAEETGFALRTPKSITQDELGSAEQIIIGSPILAMKPALAGWIKKNWSRIQDKSPVLFTTSGAPAEDPKLQQWFAKSFSEEIRKNLSYVPMGGRMILSNLSGLGRFFMKIGAMVEKDPQVKAKMLQDVDNVDRKYLVPVLAKVQPG